MLLKVYLQLCLRANIQVTACSTVPTYQQQQPVSQRQHNPTLQVWDDVTMLSRTSAVEGESAQAQSAQHAPGAVASSSPAGVIWRRRERKQTASSGDNCSLMWATDVPKAHM